MNKMFVPHKMTRDELARSIQAVISRPGMYGADEFIICLLNNSQNVIDDSYVDEAIIDRIIDETNEQ